MARDDGGGAATILVTFLLGAISGAAIAMLVTPVPGDETRRFLHDKAREGRKRAADAARQGREFVSQQRVHLEDAFERGREAYEESREHDAREKEQA